MNATPFERLEHADVEMWLQRLREIAEGERHGKEWPDGEKMRRLGLQALEIAAVVPVSLTASQLLQREFPPREDFLGGWLTRQSLAMIHAWRGTGKSFFGLEVAYAVASGGNFLKWNAREPRRVLYLDGEMPGNVLQERIARIAASADREPSEGFLRFVTPDVQYNSMPDLATTKGQELVEPLLIGVDLIIVDNLSCLSRSGGKENEAESWLPLADWSLRQRTAGRSVIFIHHSGKRGLQRGTSRREDLLDVVISLRRPTDYRPEQGARFVVAFEKARNLSGDEMTAFEAQLVTKEQSRRAWTVKSCEDTELARVAELVYAGATQKEIAEELDVTRFAAKRRIEAAIKRGLIAHTDVRDGRGGTR